MQAAVEAAHVVDEPVRNGVDLEPITEPMPRLQRAVAAQDWPGSDGQDQPGTTVRTERAAWWDHAVRSGRTVQADDDVFEDASAPEIIEPRPPEPRRAPEPMRTSKLVRAPGIGREIRPARSAAPEPLTSPLRPIRAEILGKAVTDKPSPDKYAPDKRAGDPKPGDPRPSDHKQNQERPIAQGRSALRTDSPNAADFSITADATRLRHARPRNGRLAARVAAVLVLIVAVSVVALTLSSHGGTARPGHHHHPAVGNAPIPMTVEEISAAAFVVNQVSQTALVACDPAACQALTKQGFPSRSLDLVRPNSSVPQGSAVVVLTPDLRQRFGTSWAPLVLAEYGSGGDRVTVRVVAPHGAAAYEAALRADLNQRTTLGSILAASGQISSNRVVREALYSGDVDSRLLNAIKILAAKYSINILQFGTKYPGTSPGTPFRMAQFAEADPAGNLSESEYTKSMMSLLQAQPASFRPTRMQTITYDGDLHALVVEFPAPSPLGLIASGG